MRFSTTAASALAFAGASLAAPHEKRQDASSGDVTVLQFALTLEHLENVFYHGALKKFSAGDFQKAGYSADYYNNLKYISFDEQTHVQSLEAAIKAAGATPVAACQYNFPYTDVPSFIYLSQMLENVGVSAYTGAAPLITDKTYLSIAATILDVEALHTSYQRAALGEIPMANPFETPLDPMSVYTLASMFIVKCPKSNADLGFTPFPYLTYNGAPATCEEPNCGAPSDFIKREAATATTAASTAAASTVAVTTATPNVMAKPYKGPKSGSPPSAGATVSFTAAAKIPAGSYLTFVNGLVVTSVKGTIKGTTVSGKIPTTIVGGQTYVFVTDKDLEGDFTAFSDADVLFGPAIIEVKPAAPKIDQSIS